MNWLLGYYLFVFIQFYVCVGGQVGGYWFFCFFVFFLGGQLYEGDVGCELVVVGVVDYCFVWCWGMQVVDVEIDGWCDFEIGVQMVVVCYVVGLVYYCEDGVVVQYVGVWVVDQVFVLG